MKVSSIVTFHNHLSLSTTEDKSGIVFTPRQQYFSTAIYKNPYSAVYLYKTAVKLLSTELWDLLSDRFHVKPYNDDILENGNCFFNCTNLLEMFRKKCLHVSSLLDLGRKAENWKGKKGTVQFRAWVVLLSHKFKCKSSQIQLVNGIH